MTRKPIDALKRADRTVIGAFALVLATAGAAWAYVPHTDKVAPTRPPVVALTLGDAPAGTPVPTMRPTVLPVRVIAAPTTDQVSAVARVIGNPQTECLAEAMYYEARGEGETGEKAVAEVIFHRIASGGHGGSICAVVYEGSDRTACQFSFVCDGSRAKPKVPQDWRNAEALAARILAGELRLGDETGGAVNYHATSVRPDWAARLVRTTQIGNHVFYRQRIAATDDVTLRGYLW